MFVMSYITTILFFTVQYGFSVDYLTLSLSNLLLLVLPASVLLTALSLWLCLKFKNTLTVYVILAGIWIGYLVLASMTGSPIIAGSSVINETLYQIMLWLDPYSITLIVKEMNNEDWMVNVNLFAIRAAFLIISVFILNMILNREHQQTNEVNNKPKKDVKKMGHTNNNRLFLNFVTLELTKFQLRSLLKNKITIGLLIFWPALIFNEVLSGINYSEPMSVLNPMSLDAVNRFAFDVLPYLGSLILVLWSWQIVKQDEHTKIVELIAASPVKNRQLILSQILTLALMVLILVLFSFISSTVAELIAGSVWQLSPYLISLTLASIPLILLGSIFICFHHIFKSNLIVVGFTAAIFLFKYTPIAQYFGQFLIW